MGKKEKKKHKHRERSRSRDRYDSKKKSKKSNLRDSSDSDDSDSSRERHRRMKKRSKSRDRHGRRSRSRSRDRSSRKHRRRSRSKDRVLTAAEIELLTEEKKKEKQLLKALETPEEKRARRLLKKEAKERKRKANMGWDEEYMGYTNDDNPFGDEHLLDTFVWNKKLEKSGITDLNKDQIERLQKQKMVENKLELEKVKKRRVEREKEREEREKEREMLQREKEAEYYREWEEQEDNFHLHQAKLRSNIRIEDGRAKPIDLLGKYISAEDDDFAVEMHEPYTYLNGLTLTDLEDLLEDIKVYMELEQAKNAEYWRDMTIVVQEELNKLRKLDPTGLDYIGERRSGINASVGDDVKSVFKGKSLGQLALLEDQIHKKLRGGEGVDIGYWETLLQQLKAHMARTRLRERHQEQLRRKLFKLKQQQGIESEPLFPILAADSPSQSLKGGSKPPSQQGDQESDTDNSPQPGTSGDQSQPGQATGDQSKGESGEDSGSGDEAAGGAEGEGDGEEDQILTEEDLHTQSYADYDAGSYSPRLLTVNELNPDAIVYDPEDDMKRLEFARQQLQQTGRVKKDSDAELVKRAREGMNNDEAQFSVEVPLADQNLLWSDKYRPRKPRFFNRVHTGFEWNKYNQTHYDIDNPPPKIVQGYKFNIFYPDLIDKAKTPEYILTAMPDNKDFAMLKFRAGPPYEDIAFKIVNREWEYSYKRGFRCQYHNNIFQLWFHFKRYRYRR